MGRRPISALGSRIGVVVATAALVMQTALSPAHSSAPESWPAVRASSGWTVTLGAGVSYSRFKVVTADGPLAVHHLVLDLNNSAVRLDAALAHNRLISADETVSSMVRRTGAIAGVNADFFDIRESGMPLNIMVQGGRLLRSPSRRVALAIRPDGGVEITRYEWNGAVVNLATRASHWLAGFNTGFVPDGIVAVSNVRGYGAPVPAAGLKQTVVELAPAPEVVAESGPTLVSGLVQVQDPHDRYLVKAIWPQQPYYAPFPKGTILLVGRGAAADWLGRTMAVGMPLELSLATTPSWRTAQAVLGGGPLLVENGRLVEDPYSPAPRERNRRSPVAAIGISQDGRRVLLAQVDGRQPRLSIGLTQPELAAYMRWLGAYQAMAFDSGGSVTMVARVPWKPFPCVMNSPSDGRERPVANALLIHSAAP